MSQTHANFQTVIFDLDGTVLDTLSDLTEAVNAALTAHSFPPRSKQQVRTFIGNGIRNLIIRAAGAELPDAKIDAMLSDFKTYYNAHCTDQTAPYPGIIDLLHTLREGGIQTALVSNKADFATQKLCAHFFDGLFDFVLGERPDIPRKPCPDGVRYALRELQADPKSAVYVGDSGVDVQTAAAAGMPCISVTWGFRTEAELLQSGATTLVHNCDELQAALL